MAEIQQEARVQASEIRDIYNRDGYIAPLRLFSEDEAQACLLYTSDAADE